MSERSLLIFFVCLAIGIAAAWHIFAGWFVRSQGIVPGIVLLVLLLFLSQVIKPHWED